MQVKCLPHFAVAPAPISIFLHGNKAPRVLGIGGTSRQQSASIGGPLFQKGFGRKYSIQLFVEVKGEPQYYQSHILIPLEGLPLNLFFCFSEKLGIAPELRCK